LKKTLGESLGIEKKIVLTA